MHLGNASSVSCQLILCSIESQLTVILVLAVPVSQETVIGQLPCWTCLPTLQVQLRLPVSSDVAESRSGPDG